MIRFTIKSETGIIIRTMLKHFANPIYQMRCFFEVSTKNTRLQSGGMESHKTNHNLFRGLLL